MSILLDVSVFSSVATTKLPIVERQAFIFPASIEYMQETITEKGITSKHIIGTWSFNSVIEKEKVNFKYTH